MRHVIAVLLTVTTFVSFASIASADTDETTVRQMLAGGAWTPGPFVPCTTGKVTSVGPRLEIPAGTPTAERFGSGVEVEYALPSAPRWFNSQTFHAARVVHYDHERGNAIMSRERPGDRVQVCFVAFPTPLHEPSTGAVICNPNVDSRGFEYRVYDYRLHAAYAGPDSQHSCGGA